MTYQHNNPEKQDSQDSFIFGPGDIIDIEWNPQGKELSFARRHGLEKTVLEVRLEEGELEGLRFGVGVFGVDDKVIIVQSE